MNPLQFRYDDDASAVCIVQTQERKWKVSGKGVGGKKIIGAVRPMTLPLGQPHLQFKN